MGIFAGWAAVLVGGDAREAILAARLNRAGGRVRLFGHAGESDDDLGSCLVDHWLVAPVSGIGPGGTIKGPDRTLVVTPETANQAAGVIAGAVDAAWRQRVRVPVLAYRETDVFAWKNAVPTAEGALAWALNAQPRLFTGTETVVAGFGRVSQVMAPRLAAQGARVTILARSAAARAHAEALGFSTAPLTVAPLSRAAFLFNTIPAPVFGLESAKAFQDTASVLDMASPPGGFSPEAQAWLGKRLSWHPSLPGEIAPASAADIIYDTLAWILSTSPLAVTGDPERTGST
jgi:dipicolinate synthase subunit A